MSIDFNKIIDNYGENLVEMIKDNINDVTENINYLIKLNINDIEDIFERYTFIFLDNPSSFKEKMDKLILRIGDDYNENIGNDLSILEELL